MRSAEAELRTLIRRSGAQGGWIEGLKERGYVRGIRPAWITETLVDWLRLGFVYERRPNRICLTDANHGGFPHSVPREGWHDCECDACAGACRWQARNGKKSCYMCRQNHHP